MVCAQTLPEFVFEYMLDQHGEERLAYKNLSLLLHSLHKMSSKLRASYRLKNNPKQASRGGLVVDRHRCPGGMRRQLNGRWIALEVALN